MNEISDERSYIDKPVLPEDPNSPTYNILIPVSAHWRGFTLSLGDISDLSPGDVLMLDPEKTRKVEVDLGAIPKFHASLDRAGKQISVGLTNKIE